MRKKYTEAEMESQVHSAVEESRRNWEAEREAWGEACSSRCPCKTQPGDFTRPSTVAPMIVRPDAPVDRPQHAQGCPARGRSPMEPYWCTCESR